MKIVLNKCYGGFGISIDAMEDYGIPIDVKRTDEKLITAIEKYGSKKISDSHYSKLMVVNVPDAATDWELEDYDGFESITYVLDGKLYHA